VSSGLKPTLAGITAHLSQALTLMRTISWLGLSSLIALGRQPRSYTHLLASTGLPRMLPDFPVALTIPSLWHSGAGLTYMQLDMLLSGRFKWTTFSRSTVLPRRTFKITSVCPLAWYSVLELEVDKKDQRGDKLGGWGIVVILPIRSLDK
jgi:hypothetical protein